jgi:hypothetical protein
MATMGLIDSMALVGSSVGVHIVPPTGPLRHDVSVRLFSPQQLRHSFHLVFLVPAEHGKPPSKMTPPSSYSKTPSRTSLFSNHHYVC